MATVDKRLCAGTLTASNATLYTAPATVGAITIIKAITLCNIVEAAAEVTLKFNGIPIIYAYVLASHDTITIPFADQIIEDGELIEGLSNAADSITYYVSGKEVI